MIEFLKMLTSDISFRPEDGQFRSKLSDIFIDNVDCDSTELFSGRNCDIQVSLSSHTMNDGVFNFLVVSDLGEQSMECNISVFNDEELQNFEEQLMLHVPVDTANSQHTSPKVIIRKNINGMLDAHQAAQKLGCTQVFLKSKIPCTDYTYREVDGKKEITEYYWSQDLIARLCQIKMFEPKVEDVKYIAEECCDGDNKWAKEILASFGRNVPKQLGEEAPPKGIKGRSSKVISKEIKNLPSPNKRNR